MHNPVEWPCKVIGRQNAGIPAPHRRRYQSSEARRRSGSGDIETRGAADPGQQVGSVSLYLTSSNINSDLVWTSRSKYLYIKLFFQYLTFIPSDLYLDFFDDRIRRFQYRSDPDPGGDPSGSTTLIERRFKSKDDAVYRCNIRPKRRSGLLKFQLNK